MVLSRRLCPLQSAASTTEGKCALLQFAAARDWRISSVGAYRCREANIVRAFCQRPPKKRA
jgi:hypothetical protein